MGCQRGAACVGRGLWSLEARSSEADCGRRRVRDCAAAVGPRVRMRPTDAHVAPSALPPEQTAQRAGRTQRTAARRRRHARRESAGCGRVSRQFPLGQRGRRPRGKMSRYAIPVYIDRGQIAIAQDSEVRSVADIIRRWPRSATRARCTEHQMGVCLWSAALDPPSARPSAVTAASDSPCTYQLPCMSS